MAHIVANMKNTRYGECVTALCFLQRIQSHIFLDLVFPKEINAIIILLFKEMVLTLNGVRRRNPGAIYKKINYTIYKGFCRSQEHYIRDANGKCFYGCKFGQYDEVMKNVKGNTDAMDDDSYIFNKSKDWFNYYYPYPYGKYYICRDCNIPPRAHVIKISEDNPYKIANFCQSIRIKHSNK